MIPEGAIICPQRANPTQSCDRLLGKDKLLGYNLRRGLKSCGEAYRSTTPEGSFTVSFEAVVN